MDFHLKAQPPVEADYYLNLDDLLAILSGGYTGLIISNEVDGEKEPLVTLRLKTHIDLKTILEEIEKLKGDGDG